MAYLEKTRGVMMMTKADALAIQARQIASYGAAYGVERVAALVAAATTADALADGLHDVVTINRHIPRGGSIESLIPEIREREDAIRAREAAEWEIEKARIAKREDRRAKRAA